MSGDQVMSPNAVRSTLSVMQVAGMNDYSRMFHFKVSFVTKLVNESYFCDVHIYMISLTGFLQQLNLLSLSCY